MHPRTKITELNNRVDEIENSIMNLMRLNSDKTFEILHCLIGERENIKYKLKELHKELYG
jgi:hypothetical protein